MSDLWSGKGEDGGATTRAASPPAETGDGLWSGSPRPEARRRRGGWLDPATRAARWLLPVLVVGGLVVVGWVGLDLLAVRASLQEARTTLAEVQGSLGNLELDESQTSIASAREEIADAERRAGRLTWTIAGGLPYLGPSVQATREVVEVAAAAIEVADVAVADGQALLSDGLDLVVDDGRVDLAPLLAARDLVEGLPIERLRLARDELAQPRDRWLPDQVLEGRAEVLELADEVLIQLDRADALTIALPDLLGATEPRRYFVGMQTSAELRGTGGLIGFWAVMTVDDGEVTFSPSTVHDPLVPGQVAEDGGDEGEGDDVGVVDRIRGIGLLAPENPPETDPAFLGRYGHLAAARSFPNVNLDPDLPTSSKAILDLIELRTDQRLDGVILLDPIGLQALLGATGDTLSVPGDVRGTFDLGDGLEVDRFASFITAEIYDTLGSDRSQERNDALRAIGDAAFLQVIHGGWEAPAMAGAVADATRERHLQVYTRDEHVQEALASVGATGQLELDEGADTFAITANNVVGGKQDVHLGHRFRFAIDLQRLQRDGAGDPVARRRSLVDVTVDNPLPASGLDEYIIGNCYLPGEENRCFAGDPGVNRTWFSLWTSPADQVMGFTSDDGSRPARFSSTFRDLRVIDHFLLTPSEDEATFSLDIDGEVPIREVDGGFVYEFSWWRQAKAIPDLLDVQVAPPDGWQVGDVEVVGGGSGTGLGVYGEGQELSAEVADGVAEISGTVTADLRVRVHLVPAPGSSEASP